MINQAVLLAVLIGTGAVSVVLTSIVVQEYSFFSAVIPCICILTYVLVNKRRGCIGSSLMQVADNTYFMGFIFTLVGLVAVLYSIGKHSFQLEAVLANAGMAFSTTLLASFLRLLLVQGAITMDEAGSQAEQALIHATHQYIGALEKSTEALSSGHQEQLRRLDAVFQTSIDTMENSVTSLNDTFIKTLAAFKETALRTSQQLRYTLESLSIPEDILVRRLNPALGQLENSLQNINAAMNTYAEDGAKSAATMNVALQATEQFTSDIARLCTDMAGAAEDVHADSGYVSEVMNGMNEVLPSLEKMAACLKDTCGMIDSMNGNINGLMSPVSRLSTGLNSVGAKLDHVNRKMSRLQQKTNDQSAQRGAA